MDDVIALRDMFYLVFGLVAVVGTVYTVRTGNAKSSGDDRERIVRIDENTKELRSDVADIKAEMRQTRTTLTDHEKRLIAVEQTVKTQWRRIDELRLVDDMDGNHGTGKEV